MNVGCYRRLWCAASLAESSKAKQRNCNSAQVFSTTTTRFRIPWKMKECRKESVLDNAKPERLSIPGASSCSNDQITSQPTHAVLGLRSHHPSPEIPDDWPGRVQGNAKTTIALFLASHADTKVHLDGTDHASIHIGAVSTTSTGNKFGSPEIFNHVPWEAQK